MNVFEINNAIAEIENKDLDPEVLVDTIKSLELTRDQKLDGAAGLSDKYDSEIQWATDRIKELREFIKVSKNKKDRLNQYITDAIDDAGLKEIRTEHHILKPRNYRDSVIVEEIKKLPIDYVVEEKTIKADKKKLYEDLKAGKEIRSGKIKDYVVLGMTEDGETIIYINGRAPVCDGLISEAQIKATNHFENNLSKSELRNLLGDLS